MRTLKIVLLTILLSLFFASCTDLINNDDHTVMTKIENTSATGGNGGTNGNPGCVGKGC
ncbi:hypothetical protein [Pseudotenacibaculum haliotis]|uniref:Lipoprotein n=1 Tax=Pseudotenacibaculum haliotis TaxID=1862138 RepID=A0ABW5LVR3_9FLAO